MADLFDVLRSVNAVLWHDWVLFVVLATGVLFTIWTRGCPWHSLTHGVAVVLGRYDRPDDPGAIRPFQALAAALSATVGIGNIGGVALAIGLGGPGAVFWMWVIGVVGMGLKTAEVSLAMLHRDLRVPDRPRGGPMLVASRGFSALGLPRVGRWVGGVFVVTLLVASITGGNMFQAWNVAEVSHHYFGIPKLLVGLVLGLAVATVILGGIQRIGRVAGALVPFMCGTYLLAAIVVVSLHAGEVPGVLREIFVAAFHPLEARGAFLGGTAGYAMLWGLKRALFSSEAGQGSSPIAHCAAKTDEPIREGVVAGLEPFLDTLVVCTLTALVILTSGIWSRDVDLAFQVPPRVVEVDGGWTLVETPLGHLPADLDLVVGRRVFTIVQAEENAATGNDRHALGGVLELRRPEGMAVVWEVLPSSVPIRVASPGLFVRFQGAALTARAFDRSVAGLGKWLVTLAVWLFAISTMISWSYYGEQGVVYLFGGRGVLPHKLTYCGMIVVATIPSLLTSDAELDDLTTLGTGVMLWANLPILLVFAGSTMRSYRDYWCRQRRARDR